MSKAKLDDKLEVFPNALTIYINQRADFLETDLKFEDSSKIEYAKMLGELQAYSKIIQFTEAYFSNDKSFNEIMKYEHIK